LPAATSCSAGGIGATPDDHTRQAAADALGLPLVLHPQGKANIQQRITEMGEEAGVPADLNSPENLHRLKWRNSCRAPS
jgi:molybdopterin-biosynthesis enzyme MoeA-like protein